MSATVIDELSFQNTINQYKKRIDSALNEQLGDFESDLASRPNTDLLNELRETMLYSLLNGGKRVRPLLVYATAKTINNSADNNSSNKAQLDRLACAIEMIHSYSLVHDDLPAMDDDDLRRGKPTCHKAFSEASAILAGDALQTRAFELISELNCPAETRIQLIKNLSHAAGPLGMVGGQAIDLASVDQTISLEQLETLHQLKTGALIRSAVALGAIYAGANKEQLAALDHYAQAIGLSFQVQDDILDIESDTETLGKQQGADVALNKPTYPALLGLKGAKEKALQLHQQALAALSCFDEQADTLRDLSAYIISRKH